MEIDADTDTFEMETDAEKDTTQTFKTRPYQDQILSVCLKKNTIVYLPTGAGKTFIALMAMKNLAKDLDKYELTMTTIECRLKFDRFFQTTF